MATVAISIKVQPVGELETSGDGTSPTDAQMAEETQARQAFLDTVSPYLESLPNRPLRRAGNVTRVELLGGGVWSKLNHYLLLVAVDSALGRIDEELSALLPEGSLVSTVGTYGSMQEWPDPSNA